ncbi:MAG: cation:proton antiporter [bacterium]
MHSDVIAPVILGSTAILFFAIVGRFAARRLNQPAVLGELAMGIVLGTVGFYFHVDFILVLREVPALFDLVDYMLHGETLRLASEHAVGNSNSQVLIEILSGPNGEDYLKVAQTVDIFSRYGIIFMLFLVGLETSLGQLSRVGRQSTQVALIGVVIPFALGIAVTQLVLSDTSIAENLFISATLVATSVGISARVLRDIQQDQSQTARIILGAAVIDDVLGLIILAVVTGIVVSGGISFFEVSRIILMSAAFFAVAILLGPKLLQFAIWMVRRLDLIEAKMFTSFLFVMTLAWVANLIGLATIIGAFIAGVILHDGFYHHWGDASQHRLSIKDLIAPLETILAPIFFILMGIQVKLETLTDPEVLTVASLLIVVAIIGKLLAGLGALRGCNPLAVGLGMMPRGEVGLIFAALGKSLGVIDDGLFSSIVLMVIVTTLLTPPLLKAAMTGNENRPCEKAGE